jgi:hypothetical protein
MFVSEAYSQLKVVPSGRVGIGTNNPGAPLHVHGAQLLTGGNGYTLRLHPNNPTPEIGSSSGNIHFWYSGIGYNELRAKKYVKISDASLKTELSPIEYPMSKIMSLRAYRYMFLDSFPVNEAGDSVSLIPEYGFISQEIQETLQDVNITQEGKDGLLLMEYDQIIPLLVAAMQEQQNQISALEASIATMISRSQQIEEEENDTLDICRLFNADPNKTKRGFLRKGGIQHPLKPEIFIWWPSEYSRSGWVNHYDEIEGIITETHSDDKKKIEHYNYHSQGLLTRIVFYHYKDILGFRNYKFVGVFTNDKTKSNENIGTVWVRVGRVINLETLTYE